jgi:hypothetical protein
MKHIGISVMIGLMMASFLSCGQKNNAEAGGQTCLKEARAALSANNFAEAKMHIEKMRKDFPMALNAREEGILLLDSVNLAEARKQLEAWQAKMDEPGLSRVSQDTLNFNLDEAQQKVRFFEKKIEHDKAGLKHHED